LTITDRAHELLVAAAEAAADKLAEDIVAFDVSDQLAITDAFLICSAPTDRQVHAIVEGIEERMRTLGESPTRREGEREGRWVLLDYFDIVVHVQQAEDHRHYALERLWKDCPMVELPESVTTTAGRGDGTTSAGPEE